MKQELPMKRHMPLYNLLALASIFLFSQCEKNHEDSYNYPLKFMTEDYKPFNYLENSTLTGLAPDLLREICEELDIPFEVTVLPWDEAYDLAQSTDNAVLFSTDLESGRKDLFKWAGPIASTDWLFYTTSQSLITLESLEDAKQVGKIGVLEDYSIEQYLKEQGFTNLVYCTDNVDAFDKLLKGEIDMYPSDRYTAEAALNELNKSIYNVTDKWIIKTNLTYFAFNKNVPDEVVDDFQRAIDRLKAEGTLKALTQTYFNSSEVPGTLQIYTEQYPPLSFRDHLGEITGFGSDIAYEIMKRNRIFADIRLSNWDNGYNLALSNPNFCLFTMDRTEARQNLFQWVGPIGTNTTYLYTKSGSGITISSMDEARALNKLGTVSSWFSDQRLRELGFTNLVSDSDPAIMAEKLLQGEVDAFVCSSVTFPYILKELGYHYTEVEPAYTLMSSDYYIAFSKNTSSVIVNQWQTTLDAMKQDGTYQDIFRKWLQ